MCKKFLFLTSFVLVLNLVYNSYGDAVAPRPNSAKWKVVPTTLGPTLITMASPTTLDAAGDYPCEYSFECTTDGSKSSGWIADANYTAAGLTPNTTYAFRLRARDSVGNMTNYSFT